MLKLLKKKYKPDTVVNIGDEMDWHSISFHDSHPGLYSPSHELQVAREFFKNLEKSIRNSKGFSKSIRPNLFVKTGGEYFIDPTQSLGLSVTLSDGRSSRDNDNYTIDQGPGDSRYIRISDSNSDRGGYDLNLNYDKKFKNPKIVASTDGVGTKIEIANEIIASAKIANKNKK